MDLGICSVVRPKGQRVGVGFLRSGQRARSDSTVSSPGGDQGRVPAVKGF